MSDDRYVISGPVREICETLGVPFHRTRRIVIAPAEAGVEVLKENESGAAYIDEETGQLAVERFLFKVRT